MLPAPLYDDADVFCPCQDFGFKTLSDKTDHETCWRRIARWYKTCKAIHTRCHQSPSQPSEAKKWLPTRLLDTKEADQGRVKIISTASLEASERETTLYLVLSHCWGKRPFITLNQGNKARLHDSFSVDELPPNFRDAAMTTQKLGFRYVWIDSLCIIQGADGDWAEQAPLMDRVYMNAELCLAAAASEDAYGGFFRRRDPEDVQPFQIGLLVPAQEPGRATEEKDKEETKEDKPTPRSSYAYCRGQVPILIWVDSVDDAPLNLRGWVQQERVLAPRTIHFGRAQVCWECKELQAYEAGPDDAMAENRHKMVKDWETRGPETVARYQARDRARGLSLEPYAQDIYEAWRRIVGEYSRCALSFERDKLVAASGLAKAFARHLGEEYVAGLWRGHLVQELLWQRSLAIGDGARRHAEYRAPTWSWASIAGAVEWPLLGRNVKDDAEVREVRVESCTADITGEVRYAELVLAGYLLPQSSVEGKDFSKSFDVDGEELEIAPEKCVIAPLCTWTMAGGKAWKRTMGLLLVAVGEGFQAPYRRLGRFAVTARTTDQWYGSKDTMVEFKII